MAYVDWLIKGPKISSCNCAYGCPCEFNALPTHDVCEGMEAHLIEEGYFGDLRLDGIVVASRYRWPGPVHEGGGMVQGFIGENASEAQREALIKIMDGEEQEPNTVFNIYASTFETELDLVYAPIEFSCDLAKRTGHLRVPGVLEMRLEPIRNPVTGDEHPARITLPMGFEFREAEMASGTFTAAGPELEFDNKDCYGFLTHVGYGPYGIVE